MRFVRMLSNAAIAGGLGAVYLTVLLLQLNPDVPVVSGSVARWWLTFAATYGVLLAALCVALLVVREIFTLDALSPGWVSVRVLAWLAALCAAGAAALMWLNAGALALALGDAAVRRMMGGALAVTGSVVALVAIALVHAAKRHRTMTAGLFVAAVTLSVALPVLARGPAIPLPDGLPPLRSHPRGGQADRPHVTMLLLDGASLEYIRARSADGRLPNFSRLLDGGASMYLATTRPTQPGPVWAAVATGMYPAKSGVRSAARYFARGDSRAVHLLPQHCFAHGLVRIGAVRAVLHTSDVWHVRPLWEILSRAGIPSGIAGWPLTFPARPLRGFMLTDGRADGDPHVTGSVYPPDLLEDAPGHGGIAGNGLEDPLLALRSGGLDRSYADAVQMLRARRPARFAAWRIQSIDAAGHRHVASALAADDERRAPRSAAADALERAYAAVDGGIGRTLDAMAPGDLLLVVSGFGMEPLHPVKALAARLLGDSPLGGTHERAPDGFLIAYGTSVHPGRLPRGSIVDVAPTVLYFLGLPIGRDMDGFARSDLFTSEFTSERPIAFIGTYN